MTSTVPSLRKLIEDAEHALATYKYPDIDEVHRRLTEVLRAADIGDIEHEKIAELSTFRDTLTISTTWMVRQYLQSSEYKIPLEVVYADDPVYAAKVWGADQDIAVATRRVERAQSDLKRALEELEEKKAARAAIKK